jgi:alpha-beta hydrolase superfamily lysophospholipase
VDFTNETRAPLLLIAGGADHVVPAAVDKQASERFKRKSQALTEYKEFAGRSHFTVGEQGWEEVADYALDWAADHAIAGVPA